MSLRALANSCSAVVNPNIAATLRQSTPATTNPDYSQTPNYTQTTGLIQVQALSARELQHLNDMNISGVLQKLYLDGNWESVVRAQLKGGDIFLFNGETWLVVQVTERWSNWCSVAVQQQLDGGG